MGISKTEINLQRLIVAVPHQKNQAKLVHYVAKLRELLEELGAEKTPEGLESVSKAKLSDYSEKIEALASELAAPLPYEPEPIEAAPEESPSGETGLRRRTTYDQAGIAERRDETSVDKTMGSVRLDDAAHAHIEKHRKLQEDLTDEMVFLARQLKENTLLMNQSLQETEKVLDSTEKAVEYSWHESGQCSSHCCLLSEHKDLVPYLACDLIHGLHLRNGSSSHQSYMIQVLHTFNGSIVPL